MGPREIVLLVFGLSLGAIYALIVLGLVFTYRYLAPPDWLFGEGMAALAHATSSRHDEGDRR